MIGAEYHRGAEKDRIPRVAQPDRTMQMDASASVVATLSTTLRTRDIASCLPSLHRSRPLIDLVRTRWHTSHRESGRPKGRCPWRKARLRDRARLRLRHWCRQSPKMRSQKSPDGTECRCAAVASFHLAGSPPQRLASISRAAVRVPRHRPRCVARKYKWNGRTRRGAIANGLHDAHEHRRDHLLAPIAKTAASSCVDCASPRRASRRRTLALRRRSAGLAKRLGGRWPRSRAR